MSAWRHVRITVEGEARQCTNSGQGVLRVRTQSGTLMLVDPSWRGVTVEDVTPPRTWTDRDLVEARTGWLAWREGGEWWTTTQAYAGTRNASRAYGTDADIDDQLASGHLSVLRYQAGDQ